MFAAARPCAVPEPDFGVAQSNASAKTESRSRIGYRTLSARWSASARKLMASWVAQTAVAWSVTPRMCTPGAELKDGGYHSADTRCRRVRIHLPLSGRPIT